MAPAFEDILIYNESTEYTANKCNWKIKQVQEIKVFSRGKKVEGNGDVAVAIFIFVSVFKM